MLLKKNDWLLVIVNFVNIQKKREKKKIVDMYLFVYLRGVSWYIRMKEGGEIKWQDKSCASYK